MISEQRLSVKESRRHRQVVTGLFYLFQREYFTTRNTTVSSQGFKALRKTVNDSVGRLHIDPVRDELFRETWLTIIDVRLKASTPVNV